MKPSRSRLIFFAFLWASIVGGAALATPGCYGRNCEGSLQQYGLETGQGRMVDENTWESNPDNGDWLPYPKQRFYTIEAPGLGGRRPVLIIPYISATRSPYTTGGNATIASGNLGLLVNVRENHVDIINDSCSDYFLRLVITTAPFPKTPDAGIPGAPAPEGGIIDLDAGDAGADDAEAGP